MLVYALREIRRRKLRSVANMLGYIIAVAFLLIAVTLTQAYNVVADGTLEGIGTHFAVYIPASRDCPCQFGEVGPYFKNTYTPTFNSTLVDAVKGLQGVEDAAPCLMFRFQNLTICGIDVNCFATNTTTVAPDEVLNGRYLKADDANGVMLDRVFANDVKLTTGDNFSAFEYNFTVVGIVDPSLHSKPAGIADMYAPLGVVQRIARSYGETFGFAVEDVNAILVEVAPTGDPAYIGKVEQSVLGTVESYGGKSGAIVGYQCGYAARKVVSVNETSVWAVSVVLLVCVTLFSLKSQLSSIIERTKEIGILKAVGWTDSDITQQVFLESLLQGLTGGIIGISIGYLVAFLVPAMGLFSGPNLVLAVSPFMALLGLSISIAGGVLAGIIPAWRAAKLQPADALRRF